MAPPAYSTVGPYKHGVWLVVLKNGAAAIMNRAHLPAYTPGTEYYWLGSDPNQAASRLPGALGHLNLDVSTFPDATGIQPAFKGKVVGLAGDFGAPGGPPLGTPGAPTTAPTVPGATYSGGPLGGIADAITSVEDFLKLASWLFHPLNWLRAVEFLTGLAFMGWGVSTLLGTMRRGRMTHRTSIGGIFRRTFRASPPGAGKLATHDQPSRQTTRRT